MKVKETIAFIGEADETCAELIQKLASGNYPLVLVTKGKDHFEGLSKKILNDVPEADVETINCEREGCWEADIIVFNRLRADDLNLAEKIREVTNQKTLVCLLNKEDQLSTSEKEVKTFREALPNAQWVQVVFDPVAGRMYITGANDVSAIVAHIFYQVGYRTSLSMALV
jgi:hypothetical protein